MAKELEDDEFVEVMVGRTIMEFRFLPEETIEIIMSSGENVTISHSNDEDNEWHLYQIGDTEDVIGKTLSGVSVDAFEIEAPDEDDNKDSTTLTFRVEGGEVAFRWEEIGYYTDYVKFFG